MKKIIALILVVATLASVGAMAGAASETVLTTTVPAATYTLNIPANQEIPFGATKTKIGNVTVTESSGFASGKNLVVTVAFEAFKSEGVATTIPFKLQNSFEEDRLSDSNYTNAGDTPYGTGEKLTFLGESDGEVASHIHPSGVTGTNRINSIWLIVDYGAWGKALAGEYSATITFTAEVVVK